MDKVKNEDAAFQKHDDDDNDDDLLHEVSSWDWTGTNDDEDSDDDSDKTLVIPMHVKIKLKSDNNETIGGHDKATEGGNNSIHCSDDDDDDDDASISSHDSESQLKQKSVVVSSTLRRSSRVMESNQAKKERELEQLGRNIFKRDLKPNGWISRKQRNEKLDTDYIYCPQKLNIQNPKVRIREGVNCFYSYPAIAQQYITDGKRVLDILYRASHSLSSSSSSSSSSTTSDNASTTNSNNIHTAVASAASTTSSSSNILTVDASTSSKQHPNVGVSARAAGSVPSANTSSVSAATISVTTSKKPTVPKDSDVVNPVRSAAVAKKPHMASQMYENGKGKKLPPTEAKPMLPNMRDRQGTTKKKSSAKVELKNDKVIDLLSDEGEEDNDIDNLARDSVAKPCPTSSSKTCISLLDDDADECQTTLQGNRRRGMQNSAPDVKIDKNGVIEIDGSTDDDDNDVEIVTPRTASSNPATCSRTSSSKRRRLQPTLDTYYSSPEATGRTTSGRAASTFNASSPSDSSNKKPATGRRRKIRNRITDVAPSRRYQPRSDTQTNRGNNRASHHPSTGNQDGSSPSTPICLD